MTKLSKKPVDPENFGHYVNNLWSAFTLMDSKEDIKLLFKDLFTHTEYKMFTKRLEIARRLLEKQKYDGIIEALNVTARTITTVNNTLAERGEGLRKAHSKLSEFEKERWKRETDRWENMSNPFRRRSKRTTVGGQLIKMGLDKLDKKITQTIKRRSARKSLIVD